MARAFGARRSIHSLVVIGWPVFGSVPKRRPVAFLLDLLVGNRSFHHQHERLQLALLGQIPILQEVVAVLIGEHGIVQMNFGEPGNGAQNDIFDAGLRGGGDRDGVSVAAQSGGDPEDVNFGDG